MSSSKPRFFGMTLALARLAPDFVVQFFESGYCIENEAILLAQMDDIRAWLRQGGRQESQLAAEMAEILLPDTKEPLEAMSMEGEEEIDEANTPDGLSPAAAAALNMEMGILDLDPDADLIDPKGLGMLMEMIIEDADSLCKWSIQEIGLPFSASLSITLPPPNKHPLIKAAEMKKIFENKGFSSLWEELSVKEVNEERLSGVLNVDLYTVQTPPSAVYPEETAVTQVAMDDARAGDKTKLALSFHYPKAMAAYFEIVLDAARKHMNLK